MLCQLFSHEPVLFSSCQKKSFPIFVDYIRTRQFRAHKLCRDCRVEKRPPKFFFGALIRLTGWQYIDSNLWIGHWRPITAQMVSAESPLLFFRLIHSMGTKNSEPEFMLCTAFAIIIVVRHIFAHLLVNCCRCAKINQKYVNLNNIHFGEAETNARKFQRPIRSMDWWNWLLNWLLKWRIALDVNRLRWFDCIRRLDYTIHNMKQNEFDFSIWNRYKYAEYWRHKN